MTARTVPTPSPRRVKRPAGPRNLRSPRRPPGRARWSRPPATRGRRRAARGRVLGGMDPDRTDAPPGLPPAAQDLHLLAELLAAGVPLVEALRAVGADPSDRRVGIRFADAAELVGRGRSVAAVLGAGTPHLTTLLSAGERTGRLADAVRAAADLEDRLDTARRRVRAALAYPALVMVVAAAVVGVVVTTIVPQLAATFADLGSELPLVTRVVVRAAGAVASPVTVLIPVLVGAATLLRRRTRGDRAAAAGPLRVRLPGPIRLPLEVAVAARVASTLLDSGLPLADTLAAAAVGAADPEVRSAMAAAADRVRGGRDLAGTEALAALLPRADVAMLAVGEARGLLAPQLRRVADRRLAELERRLELVGTLAEPLLVLVVGAVVGAVVAALYLPSFRVLELI